MSSMPTEKRNVDDGFADPNGTGSSSGTEIGNNLSHTETYQEHGAPIDNLPHNNDQDEDYQRHKHLLWTRIRQQMRDPFAEFMGTFTMIMFGDGSVAQVLLSSNPSLPKGDQSKGAYQSISWGSVNLPTV